MIKIEIDKDELIALITYQTERCKTTANRDDADDRMLRIAELKSIGRRKGLAL